MMRSALAMEASMERGAGGCHLEHQGQPSLPGAVFCLDPVGRCQV